MIKKNNKIWFGVVLVLIIIIAVVVATKDSGPAPFDGFAKCLTEKNATFYGAFWCPLCQNQKKMFGKSTKFLKYIECSTPNGKSQKQECTDAGITGYPTWEFADGSRESGEVALSTLAEKTGCELPISE